MAQINSARLYSQKVIVDLDILNQNIRVLSENNKDIFEISIHPDSGISRNSDTQQFYIAGCSVPVISIPTGITIFWMNHQSAIRHLLKIFRCKFSTIIYYYSSEIYRSVFSELLDLQLAFKKITFYLIGSEDQNLLWNQIARYLGLVEDLSILSVADPNFIPVFTSWPQKIYIPSSAWFTLDHFLACTCTRITLFQSHLENKDLDVILRSWKAGKLPNLKCLWLDSLGITDTGATILGMKFSEFDEKVILTDDGSKKATLTIKDQRVVMSVTPFE